MITLQQTRGTRLAARRAELRALARRSREVVLLAGIVGVLTGFGVAAFDSVVGLIAAVVAEMLMRRSLVTTYQHAASDPEPVPSGSPFAHGARPSRIPRALPSYNRSRLTRRRTR